jgi:two-component system sensor histidine kinase UhpB
MAKRSRLSFPAILRRGNHLARHWSNLSPNQLLLILAVLIFIAEMFDMLLLDLFPGLSRMQEAFLDSCILLAFLSPVYFFIYRPYWQKRQRAADEIRSLSRQLIRAEEESRKALARDLHDEFGQTLGALQLGLETIKNTLPGGEERLVAQCDRLSRMTAQLGSHVRDLTTQLRPDILDNLGLISALHWQAKQFRLRHPNVQLILNLPEIDAGVSPEACLILYRVCQESLLNVARHASAKRVLLELSFSAGEAVLTVEDDGVGCAAGTRRDKVCEQPAGFGIIGMRERVNDGGGRIQLFSLPEVGTRIEVTLPLSREGEL